MSADQTFILCVAIYGAVAWIIVAAMIIYNPDDWSVPIGAGVTWPVLLVVGLFAAVVALPGVGLAFLFCKVMAIWEARANGKQ